MPAAGMLLALACGVKPIAFILAAFWFIARPRLAWVGPFILTCLLLGSVLLIQDGYVGFFKTLRTYTQEWEANGSFFHLVRTQMKPRWPLGELFVQPWEAARIWGGQIMALLAISLIWRRTDWLTAFYWLVLTALLVSPIVYPWYLLWLLAIVPLVPNGRGLTGLIFAATSVLCYRLWHTDWIMPWPIFFAEYVPVYAALIYEVKTRMTKPEFRIKSE
ncbi:MAG: hypothetical protein H7144_12155 [Burkholderiales bacterium]|nr:hypothetical protein [Phycisphaerae bacterium]